MDNSLTVAVLCVLVLFSAFFSATETAFTSASKSKLTLLADKKNKKAILVLKMLDKYDRIISTILVGNNIVNIAATSLSTILFIRLMQSEEVGSTVATVVTTVVVLIFGEVTPKTLAKENSESFCLFAAPILLFMSWIFFPVTYLFSLLKKLLDKIVKNKDDKKVTDEELITIVEEACDTGGIDDVESELICSAIEFNDRSVFEILTPRIDLVAVPDDISLEDITKVFRESMFSRLPVYHESIDNVIGIVLEKECCYLDPDCDFKVTDHMKKPLFVSEASKVGDLLKKFQKEKTQMGVVIDEYGGTLGIVTVEDIIEELVGEIWDEYDEIEEDIIEIDETTFKVMGSTATSKLFRKLDLAEDEESEAATVSGWAIEKLGRIPASGDFFEYENIRVEILATDLKKIEELLITLVKEDEEEEK
jgi:CBS domain containing-hemolysin-like protein